MRARDQVCASSHGWLVSVSNSATLTALNTVSVAPTQTTLMTWTKEQLKGAKRVTAYVYNADASQPFTGIVQRRMTNATSWASSSIPDFSSVGAQTAVMADLDVEGSDEVRIVGTMSGAGGNVQCGATRKAATP